MGAFQWTRCIALSLGMLAPVMAFAQAPAPAPVQISPDIDNYAGIFFFCKGLVNEAWTTRACEEMGISLSTQAAKAQKPIALLRMGDTPDKYPELAKAQGFDSNRAVWFLMTIDPHARSKGQWEIAARADGIKKTTSTTAPPQTVTYSKRATVVSASAVAEKGAELLSSLMLVLTTPMRPL
jgi:hypothetical protein